MIWGILKSSKSRRSKTISDTKIEAPPLIPKIKKINKRCGLDLALKTSSNFLVKDKIFSTANITTTLEI